MAEYICIDGPLEGRRFSWRRAPRAGKPVTVAMLDVDHAVLEVDYRLQPDAGRAGSGRLEFVEARDAHPGGRLLALGARLRGRLEHEHHDGRRQPGRVARALSRAAHLGARVERPAG